MTIPKYILAFILSAALVTAANAKTVALVLSGGGSRGFASIGVLQALEEEHLAPDMIVGTSIGAIIGGLYASGYSAAELRTIAVHTEWEQLFLDRPARRNLFLAQKETNARHIFSVRFRGWTPEVPNALTNGQKLSDLLFELVHRAPYQPWPSFDDLKVPFRAVATDLNTGRPVVFDHGDLAEAMRASISLPLVFKPYAMDTLLLADGGVTENIPVDIARRQGADAVVAVDMTANLGSDENMSLPWELVGRVTTILQETRKQASLADADFVITPVLDQHRVGDFSDVGVLISAGYLAAKAQMARLRALFHPEDSSAAAQSSIYCSRKTFTDFRATVPESELPPTGYDFVGVSHVPDSSLKALPPGPLGLRKLGWLRRLYLDQSRSLAHATQLSMTGDRRLKSVWQEGVIRRIRV